MKERKAIIALWFAKIDGKYNFNICSIFNYNKVSVKIIFPLYFLSF